ncbi:MAG: serine/threonine-protein kinase [Gemmataceae bacterium]
MSVPPTPADLTGSSRHSNPTHCRVGGWAGGSQYTLELGRLLQSRLRIVSLIALIPLGLFLVRRLTEADPPEAVPFYLPLHVAVTLVVFGLTAALWSIAELSFCWSRRLELLLFTSLGLYFGWMQIHMLSTDRLFEAITPEDSLGLLRLWIDNSALRWFFLIVVYGVFIPNTWKRCAMLTGVTALMPLALTPLGAMLYDRLGPGVGEGLVDLCIVLATAWAIAVFGAYRLQVLQQEAFQARRLGQYQLGERLGTGGMGQVYEAEHVLLRRRCALKLIRADQMQDPFALTRFEREVRAMATLTHWNTVEVYDYGRSDDGTFYYVMEYLDGLTLESLVARYGTLPPGRVIHLLRQVCAALHEAHGIGLLHRDIKPSNIMACRLGGVHDVAKLLDFGLVQQTRPGPEALRLTSQGAILGSPPFMSPEQAVGRQDLDGRTDIYSIGGVAYFLLTGQPPYVRETAMEMMLAHVYEPLPRPSLLRQGLPDDLEAIITRCMEKKVADRFENIDALDRALAACRDAGHWSEEQAGTWWQQVTILPATTENSSPTVVAPTRARLLA